MKTLKNKWYAFDRAKGSRQALPHQKEWVLVQTKGNDSLPPGVAVGYLKFAAGDKQCPYFVVAGDTPQTVS